MAPAVVLTRVWVVAPCDAFGPGRRGWAHAGHGFKLAPAVGSLVAQQITGTRLEGALGETSIPLDFLGPHRRSLMETDNWEEKTHFA